jgi:hypothetical protein
MLLENGERFEIESFLLEESLSNERLLEYTTKNLSDSKESSIQVILTENETRNAEVELFILKLKIRLGMIESKTIKNLKEYRAHINSEAKTLAGRSKAAFERHERISLSILRTVVNGSIVSVGIVLNGGIPPSTALAIGFFSGAISGFFQYNNALFQSFVDGNHERNTRLIETKKFGSTRVKSVQMTKWFFTEISLYSIISAFNMAMGVPTGSFMTEALNVFKSSLFATGSQGLWDSTIASETRMELRDAQGNPNEQARIQMKSNLKTFAVSMASMFGGVMTLMGANIGTWSLGALGISGAIYTYHSYKNKNSVKDGAIQTGLSCRKIFAI